MSDKKIESVHQVFIASVKNINYFDLLEYLRPKISRDANEFPKGTVFYVLSGIHHGHEGELGETDPSLHSQFHYALFNNLANYCGYLDCEQCRGFLVEPCASNSSVWEDMDYRDKIVPLYTISNDSSDDEENVSYQLSRKSIIDLKHLCQDIMNENRPTALIFASCNSS